MHSPLYIYTRSGQAVKRKKGPGQTVKSGFRAESSGQDRFQAVKNLDPGRGRSYGKYWSDRPLCTLFSIQYFIIQGQRSQGLTGLATAPSEHLDGQLTSESPFRIVESG